ncbi:MAG: lysophospholipase [Proteobacteria bacterium]|nr:lysophospholipase [Pseudomonadota bacterium]
MTRKRFHRQSKANSEPQGMTMAGYFPGAGGTKIFWQAWVPPTDRENTEERKSRPLILLAHGLGEHSGRYANVVNRLFPRGYPIFALDHRGHGRSEGKRGHIESFSEYLEDLKTLQALAVEKTGKNRVILIGHSLGGLIALAYALENQGTLAGVVASSPALKLKVQVPWIKAFLGKTLSRIFPTLSMDNGLNAEYLSHDPQVVKNYLEDPLVHKKVSARWFTEINSRMESTQAQAFQLTIPILLIHGGDDQLTDPRGTETFASRVGSVRKKFITYPGFYHESFNEVEKEKALRDLENWLNDN